MDGPSWVTIGLWIDLLSGLFFIPIAWYVGSKQPRTRAGFWFAVFAFALAGRTVIDNASALELIPWMPRREPLHFGWLTVTAMVIVVALVMMVKRLAPIKKPWLLFFPLPYLLASYLSLTDQHTLGEFAAGSTAVIYNITMWWVVYQLMGREHQAIGAAIVPYATIYSFNGLMEQMVLTEGTAWIRWTIVFAPALLAMVWVLYAALYRRRYFEAGVIVAFTLVALIFGLIAGDDARDKGLNGATRILLVLGLGYAIVKHRAFDIDVKLRFTIKQSTLVAIFVATFAGVQTLVGEFFTETSGLVAGAVATAGLVLIMAPIQQIADRVAGAAMPNAKPIATRTQIERLQIYRNLSLAAWDGNQVTKRELGLLETARQQLDLELGATAKIDLEVRELVESGRVQVPAAAPG